MKIAVIGASGFVGQRVVQILQDLPNITEVRALDRVAPETTGKTIGLGGDFADPGLRKDAIEGADAVICLAAILGGAAEADYTLARRVNVDATMDLIEAVREENPGSRFVFASTIATIKTPMPHPVTDAAPLGSGLVYGAQKHMIEVLLSHFAARGWLDAVSLRPSGVMARDGADKALKTAFMSRVFYAVKRGEDITLPVAQDSKTWLASVENVAQNFVHGALIKDLGQERAFTLPALAITFGDLVAALKRRFPDSPATVRFAPDETTIKLFAAMPDLETETADALGFTRDADADALVRDAF